MPTKLARVAALRCAGIMEVQPTREKDNSHMSSDALSPELEAFHINDEKSTTPPRFESPATAWKNMLAGHSQQTRFDATREQLARERDSDIAMLECLSPSPCKSFVGRKRGRSSVDLTLLQHSLRQQLQEEPQAFNGAVLEDQLVAKSFMLDRPDALDLSVSGSGLATPVNCSKKVRTTSSCSTQVRGTLRLEGGPGMWNGIL